MRSELLAQIISNLAGTSISVSQELPWNSGGQVLYMKNKKHFYLDEEQKEVTPFIKTLDKQYVNTDTVTITGYLTVDAKNQPSDISSVVANILSAESVITSSTENTATYNIEITGDDITYTFEFEFITIT